MVGNLHTQKISNYLVLKQKKMIRRNLLFIEVIILIVIALSFMFYISYQEGKIATTKVLEVKQKKQDSTIAHYAHTIDSLTNCNDSISQKLDACQHEIDKYVYSVDYLFNQNPKAAAQFVEHFLKETE
jgi:hypothetical protein